LQWDGLNVEKINHSLRLHDFNQGVGLALEAKVLKAVFLP
jgi:hypothetical protein